jgi:hypothetical protein
MTGGVGMLDQASFFRQGAPKERSRWVRQAKSEPERCALWAGDSARAECVWVWMCGWVDDGGAIEPSILMLLLLLLLLLLHALAQALLPHTILYFTALAPSTAALPSRLSLWSSSHLDASDIVTSQHSFALIS